MKQFIGQSNTGNLQEAIKGLSNPSAIVYITGKNYFEQVTENLYKTFPNTEMIGCVGEGYAKTGFLLDGIIVVGFYDGAKASAGVIEDVGTMPLAGIKDIEKAYNSIGANENDTVCLDFTTGNDAQLVTTFNIVLKRGNVSLVGGTAWENTVGYNGKVYHDAAVFMFIKNTVGKIRAYRENIYGAHEANVRYIATKVDTEKSIIYELDNKPVREVYTKLLGVSEREIPDQTFANPLGRYIGNELYLISLKSKVDRGGIECYKKVNSLDIITVMQLLDYKQIAKDTCAEMKRDFPDAKGIFSINCIFRYLLFEKEKFKDEYLRIVNDVAPQAGLIGLGEHYKTQHVNQTLSCFVFN